MNIKVTTNGADVSRSLHFLFRDQVPYALKEAVRWTALDFQEEQREHMEEIFTVRRKRFVIWGVKITHWPKKSDPVAIVAIDPPGNRDDILTKFETERVKLPRRGSRLAVPVDAPRTGTGVLRGARGKGGALGRYDFERIPGTDVFRGKRRTFMILQPGGRGVVLQRQRRSSSSSTPRQGDDPAVQTLFYFTPRVSIDPELNFRENAARTVRDEFEDNFQRAFDRAVFTSRPR